MKKIAMISTGGTISMQSDADGLAQVSLGAQDLLDMANFDNDDIEVVEIEFIKKPGAHITLEDLKNLKETIETAVAEDGIEGVVITHGTDTLEETAYFLDIVLDSDIPVAVTGAQRNPSLPMSDTVLNIVNSVMVVADDDAKGMGVLIVFNSEIIPARDAIKAHKSLVSSFQGVEFGHIGAVNNDRVIWSRRPLIQDHYNLGESFAEKRVDIIPAYLGQDDVQIKDAITNGAAGIIIEGIGGGHLPEAMLPGIEEAIAKDIPVVLTSRVRLGRLFTDTYGFKGSETYLRKMGVILGEDLTPAKLRLKLLVLLSNDYNYDQMKEAFEANFYS